MKSLRKYRNFLSKWLNRLLQEEKDALSQALTQ
ncbi:Uncharacterised protein [Chlamydia abortus]|nr:Uncharacterised protein [Chlamydia abortus]